MNTKTVIAAAVALLIGAGGGYALASMQSPATHTMPSGMTMAGRQDAGMQDSMAAMMAGLSGKTGDDFDKAFLAAMTMHHEGAVAMAQAALQSARHSEIKQMANAIISAQTAEIDQMKSWRTSWYGASE